MGHAKTGGEAGLHPSNIHDNPPTRWARLMFTVNMPVILDQDGPAWGGCLPGEHYRSRPGQMGQLKAGGSQCAFIPVRWRTARELAMLRQQECRMRARSALQRVPLSAPESPIVRIWRRDTRLVARLVRLILNLLLEIGQPN